MRWRKTIPFGCTLAALVAGLFSILKSADGEFMAAAQFIMLSMVLDGLDGNLARWLRGTSRFGAELDTFVDICSFGVAPAVMVYEGIFRNMHFWSLAMPSLILVSGAVRLARFRVVDPYRGQRGYLGLPITVSAGWMAMFVFIWASGVLDEEVFSLVRGPWAAFVWGSTLAMLGLQVSHVRYAKLTKEIGFFAICVFFVLFLFMRTDVAVVAALAISAAGFIYAFVTPFFPKHPIAGEEEEPVSVHPS